MVVFKRFTLTNCSRRIRTLPSFLASVGLRCPPVSLLVDYDQLIFLPQHIRNEFCGLHDD